MRENVTIFPLKSKEGVAKIALEAKFDDFGVGAFSSQIDIIELD